MMSIIGFCKVWVIIRCVLSVQIIAYNHTLYFFHVVNFKHLQSMLIDHLHQWRLVGTIEVFILRKLQYVNHLCRELLTLFKASC